RCRRCRRRTPPPPARAPREIPSPAASFVRPHLHRGRARILEVDVLDRRGDEVDPAAQRAECSELRFQTGAILSADHLTENDRPSAIGLRREDLTTVQLEGRDRDLEGGTETR